MSPAEREAAILALVPKVQRIARRYATPHVSVLDRDDLIQEGMIGLMDALGKYDATRDNSFETYADARIVGAMRDAKRAMDPAPRSLRRKQQALQRATATFTAQQGRAPDSGELAQQAGIALDVCQRWQRELQALQTLSLDARVTGHSANDTHYYFVDLNFYAFLIQEEAETLDLFLQRLLADILAGMPASERLLLTWYYEDDLTMKAIGQRLGVNETRICQQHTRMLARLRARLFGRLGLPADAEPPLPLADRPRRLLTPAERGQRRDKARLYLREWHTRRKELAHAH